MATPMPAVPWTIQLCCLVFTTSLINTMDWAVQREKRRAASWRSFFRNRVRGNLKERDQQGEVWRQKGLRGGRGGKGIWGCVLVSVSEKDVSTCRSPHSRTFQGSLRQSVVRGPGTDLGSACQRQISLKEIARDPYSHVHDTRRHKKHTCMTSMYTHTHTPAHTEKYSLHFRKRKLSIFFLTLLLPFRSIWPHSMFNVGVPWGQFDPRLFFTVSNI